MKSLRDLICVAGFLLLTSLLIESGLRGAGERFQASFYLPERSRGYALRPGAEGWNVKEHDNFVRINSRGLRDREHDLQRPVDTIRVAVIGDSVTEAMEISLESAYFERMERELNTMFSRYGRKVEVIAFGVGGYGLGPQYLTMKEQIWQYDPQIVLVVPTIDGLVLRSSRRLYPGDPVGAPFFDLRSGKLQLDPESERRWRTFIPSGATHGLSGDLMNRSLLLSLFNSARVKATGDAEPWNSVFHTKASSPSRLPADYWQRYPLLGPANPELKDAIEVAQALLLAMRDEAASRHAELWLFTLDTPEQVEPDPGLRARFLNKIGVDTLFKTDRLVSDFATRNGILNLALAPELARFATEKSVVLHGFKGTPRNSGHLNEIGHMVAGHLIAQRLRENSAVLRQLRVADESAFDHSRQSSAGH
jgi:hypothetical protein